MSYQVLARKWRPSNFEELVGQKQTAQALINALENDRLHHAYLFTGTRGVGKTTIARILAKCLNCENGITAKPCGQCSSCTEIAHGNFVDLLEIDAASKTKVEDTRELLDNVQYRPTRGRYKVYLIDEVHMLSGHSFNALLKTLEEPPPHVVFLLATTDPQKLPVTVLSRCLQFHLRRMEENEIDSHLKLILKDESITFEEAALEIISKAADGSMRDALSLLDQAIAFCNQDIKADQVAEMLGAIDKKYVYQLFEALISSDVELLMEKIRHIAEYTPDYNELLIEWLSLLHEIAVYQATQSSDDKMIVSLAGQITPADLQLFYQLSLQARKDLPYAPYPRQGFEMAMLRIMTFKPAGQGNSSNTSNSSGSQSNEKAEQSQQTKKKSEAAISTSHQTESKPVELKDQNIKVESYPSSDVSNSNETIAEPAINTIQSETIIPLTQLDSSNWHDITAQLDIQGNGLQVLLNSNASFKDNKLTIVHSDMVSALITDSAVDLIKENLQSYFNEEKLTINLQSATDLDETPLQIKKRIQQAEIDQAEAKLLENDQIQYMLDQLEAKIETGTIKPN
ncbi:MAG: DNA polymerase III subunit gamma/tau [Gammaproteobacteria bacterium]|nr:DNA polymerase III subunit gamma/tau [Gammaproteobacteria bacterium]